MAATKFEKDIVIPTASREEFLPQRTQSERRRERTPFLLLSQLFPLLFSPFGQDDRHQNIGVCQLLRNCLSIQRIAIDAINSGSRVGYPTVVMDLVWLGLREPSIEALAPFG
uniref:Uncharacterized protein n=1 Tax=Candidatus Kentrum sp. MB TaxID=2138164 RepID=A0A450XDS0_9GAMM|nr:MAG: hypothetical protein BECKMB1821I_GA0114274_100342 [Candidatus Kentron sp. MB]VFK28619.1 MAG: hypothetical protein BECKMB1821G_GA0114241_103925 [Candidatus Kentron sp. MB]VFK74314.1 MAG: hypothetical protein BECKMB1821H_GA0114242_100342 [Candidatus Kentron sp. MB]